MIFLRLFVISLVIFGCGADFVPKGFYSKDPLNTLDYEGCPTTAYLGHLFGALSETFLNMADRSTRRPQEINNYRHRDRHFNHYSPYGYRGNHGHYYSHGYGYHHPPPSPMPMGPYHGPPPPGGPFQVPPPPGGPFQGPPSPSVPFHGPPSPGGPFHVPRPPGGPFRGPPQPGRPFGGPPQPSGPFGPFFPQKQFNRPPVAVNSWNTFPARNPFLKNGHFPHQTPTQLPGFPVNAPQIPQAGDLSNGFPYFLSNAPGGSLGGVDENKQIISQLQPNTQIRSQLQPQPQMHPDLQSERNRQSEINPQSESDLESQQQHNSKDGLDDFVFKIFNQEKEVPSSTQTDIQSALARKDPDAEVQPENMGQLTMDMSLTTSSPDEILTPDEWDDLVQSVFEQDSMGTSQPRINKEDLLEDVDIRK